MRIWIVAAGAGLSLLGILVAGKLTGDTVRDWDRYRIAFADIACTPPPGQERGDFLAEVQYLAGMPDRLSLLEENLAGRLADAFARHPRVEEVEQVTLLPPRRVNVRLRFRDGPRQSAVANAQ
jgi:hypothetical protein